MWSRLRIINNVTKKNSCCNYLCINSLLICAGKVPYGGINAMILTPGQRGTNRIKLLLSANQKMWIRMVPIIILRQTRGRNCQGWF